MISASLARGVATRAAIAASILLSIAAGSAHATLGWPTGCGTRTDRPFIAKRAFVWGGDALAAEVGLNFSEQPIWRQQYVPGPSGLDDAPQVRVEKDLQGTPSESLFALVRDELGTVIAVAQDRTPDPGSRTPVLARYLYTPYGEAHIEAGPEPVRIEYDASVTQAAGQTQTIIPK